MQNLKRGIEVGRTNPESFELNPRMQNLKRGIEVGRTNPESFELNPRNLNLSLAFSSSSALIPKPLKNNIIRVY